MLGEGVENKSFEPPGALCRLDVGGAADTNQNHIPNVPFLVETKYVQQNQVPSGVCETSE